MGSTRTSSPPDTSAHARGGDGRQHCLLPSPISEAPGPTRKSFFHESQQHIQHASFWTRGANDGINALNDMYSSLSSSSSVVENMAQPFRDMCEQSCYVRRAESTLVHRKGRPCSTTMGRLQFAHMSDHQRLCLLMEMSSPPYLLYSWG